MITAKEIFAVAKEGKIGTTTRRKFPGANDGVEYPTLIWGSDFGDLDPMHELMHLAAGQVGFHTGDAVDEEMRIWAISNYMEWERGGKGFSPGWGGHTYNENNSHWRKFASLDDGQSPAFAVTPGKPLPDCSKAVPIDKAKKKSG